MREELFVCPSAKVSSFGSPGRSQVRDHRDRLPHGQGEQAASRM